MEPLPIYVYLVFGTTVLLALFLFYSATQNAKSFLAIMLAWVILQSLLGLSGFYSAAGTKPPRLPLLILPPVLAMLVRFNTRKGKLFIDQLNIKRLTIFHVIRIPVELVLFWLCVHKAVPVAMTFEGRNFDILSGLSAPFIYYFGFVKNKLSKNILLAWNFICLGLLLNVVITAILSAPGAIQQLSFDQPNIAILHFPFLLLPGCLVPLVLFSHLATIRQLLTKPSYGLQI